ncbi:hypothetical protein [Amycolatopsis sp. NPDC051371]|uniref:hypothetical protein n=1 Tax=Amycolatopsis sp. NPDC051371 TaxID=3155800 RepID=UPI00343106B2
MSRTQTGAPATATEPPAVDYYNAPNFVGESFALTPTDTPFLSAIGGLTGGKRATPGNGSPPKTRPRPADDPPASSRRHPTST